MQILLFILLFLILVFLPGFLVYKLIAGPKEERALFYLPISFTFGLGFFSLISTSAYFFNFSWQNFNLVYSLSLVSLVAGFLYKKKKLTLQFEFDFVERLVLFLSLALTLYTMFIHPVLAYTDAPFHLAEIRKLVEEPVISPSEASLPTGKINPSYGFNSWFLLLAFLQRLSGLELFQLWDRIALVLVPTYILAVYFFISKLISDKSQTLTVLLVYLVFVILLNNSVDFRTIALPERIVRLILLTTSLGLFLTYLKNKNFLSLTSLGLVSFTITTIHLYAWVHLLLAVGAFSLANFIFKNYEDFKNSLKAFFIILLAPAPYLAVKLANVANVVLPDAFAVNTSTLKLEYLFRSKVGYTLILLLVLVYLFRKKLSEEKWLLFSTATAVTSLFILFNPILFPIVAGIISVPYTQRLSYLIYTEIILGSFLYLFVINKFLVRAEKKIFLALAVAITAGALLIPSTNFPGLNVFSMKGNLKFAQDYQEPIFDFINKNLPKKKVYVANYDLAYWIPAYSYNYILMTYPDHTTFTINHKPRIETLKNILDPDFSIEGTVTYLDQYSVNYVVLDKVKEEKVKKFGQDTRFKLIYEDSWYLIYSFNE
nr:hypothetical protein [uncultured archaeon]